MKNYSVAHGKKVRCPSFFNATGNGLLGNVDVYLLFHKVG